MIQCIYIYTPTNITFEATTLQRCDGRVQNTKDLIMYFLGADFVIKTHLSTKSDHIIQVSVSLSNVFKLCFCIHESTLCFLNSSPQFIDPSILHHNFCVKTLGSFFAITKLHSVCNLNCYVRLCSFWKNLRLCAHHSVSFPHVHVHTHHCG